MLLPDKAVQELQALMREKYGIELTEEQAQEQGKRLIGLFRILNEIDRK
jgi:hypothetical protein